LKCSPERGRRLITRHAGIFLFLPLLSRLRFDQMVDAAGDPGTQMISPANALLSLLTLKLLDKERLSHMDDFNCDEVLGLFAGLNILPKKSFATDYSYRTIRDNQVQLLERWVKKLSPLLFPDADSFLLDFHAIGHRIKPSGYEGEIRQVVVTGLGRKHPTFFLTNNVNVTARDLVTHDARRNGAE